MNSKYCELNEYIFEPLNPARKVKFKKLFSKVNGADVLDLGCGYAGLYWALSYFERVKNIYFYDYYAFNIDILNLIIQKLTPEYIQENFADTVAFLKKIKLIDPTKSILKIAEELLSKIKHVKIHDFLCDLPNCTFDVVISSEAIECVEDEDEFNKVLKNIFNALKPMGKLIGNILNYNKLTEFTQSLITQKMDGKLNPNEVELRMYLEKQGYTNICIEVIRFRSLGNRSKYI